MSLNCFINDLREKRQLLLDGLAANEEDIKLAIFEDFYPDKAHFIYELLQNAEDAEASKVRFSLSEKRLLFEHDGRPFNKQDIRGITGIGTGTKKNDDDQIGCFGIGFKAVFVYTETPCIWSPTCSFGISELVLPQVLNPDPSLGNRTRFAFPFNSPKKSAREAYEEIHAGLEEISETALLFLSHIENITWIEENNRETQLLRVQHSKNHIETRKKSDNNATESSHFLRFAQPVKELKRQYCAIAFEMEPLSSDREFFADDIPLRERFRIVQAKPGRVSVYFIAKKETSGLRFHLHAPFVPELSRASIKETPANKPLFVQLAELTAKSLPEIRDFGLLNTEFLAVLPNKNDDLPDPYIPIRDAVINAMNQQPLTPTYPPMQRGYAPANQLLQAPVALKVLLDEKDLQFLVDFPFGLENTPAWAIAATQRNSNIDRFLSSLGIKEWGVEEFFQILCKENIRLASNSSFSKFVEWIKTKSDEWHQRLYALLYSEFEPKSQFQRAKDLHIVRCSPGGYQIGNRCFFLTDEIQEASILPCVAKGTYTSGRREIEKKSAKKFLEEIGVREVDERILAESILEKRYTENSHDIDDETYRDDLRRFVKLVKDDRKLAAIFRDYRIFEAADQLWHTPETLYLDVPYRQTELRLYYRYEWGIRHPLSRRYLKLNVLDEDFVAFVEAVGVKTKLSIEKQSTNMHSMRASLWQAWPPRVQRKSVGIDEDWMIEKLDMVLKYPSTEVSKLIWHTLMEANPATFKARYSPSRRYEPETKPSTLILTLQKHRWIPQQNSDFVHPPEAIRDLLPGDFPFAAEWEWIKAIRFGEKANQRMEAVHKQPEATERQHREQQEAAEKHFGFKHDVRHIKWIFDLGLGPKELQNLEEHARKLTVNLPEHKPGNRKRRHDVVLENADEAPERITEKRMRSVPINRDVVKAETDPYLRQQYTNDDGVMICQVCKKELPFKLNNGNYFFEAEPFLPELEKHHYQNYLALCPNHAAMYRYAHDTEDQTKDLFLRLDSKEMAVVLAGQDETVYFTETHRVDLRAVIESEQ